MIQPKMQRRGLKIIQDLIIKTRSLAYEGADTNLIAGLLDKVEYLPAFMLEEKDRTELFDKSVVSICADYNCPEVLLRNKK